MPVKADYRCGVQPFGTTTSYPKRTRPDFKTSLRLQRSASSCTRVDPPSSRDKGATDSRRFCLRVG